MKTEKMIHPATYSAPILEEFSGILQDRLAIQKDLPIRVLDPFAGTGKIHTLGGNLVKTTGIEIQPQWAALHPQTLQGDATALPADWTASFDVVMTSPTYGNRFADRHRAKDGSIRRSYTHDLRRMTGDDELELESTNTGRYLFHTKQYKDLHVKAWNEVWRVLVRGGWFVLNVSDSIKSNEVVEVCQWHLDIAADIGFKMVKVIQVDTRRMGFGQNGKARVDYEMVYVMVKP